MVDLLFDWFGLVCFANKNKKTVSIHTADSKQVKQEVNGTEILPPIVFPDITTKPKHGRWGVVPMSSLSILFC